jgi:hypothetical protein
VAEGVEVRLGADVSGATSSMDEAAKSIAASLAQISSALAAFTTKHKTDTAQALKNNADLSRSFLELKGSVKEGFDGVAGVVERFRGVLGSLTLALGGGALFGEAIKETLAFEDTVRGLMITLGMTADRATTFGIALKLAGVDAGAFEQMAMRVGRRLLTQGDEFDRLGVKVKDATGSFLPMEQIMQNVYKRMLDFKVGTDQQMFALEAVGRNAKDFATDMERLNRVQERAKQLQEEYNIEMGPDKIDRLENYRVEVNAFQVGLGALADKIGEAVLPSLERLARYFGEIGPQAVTALLNAIKGFLIIGETLVAGIRIMIEAWIALVKTIADAEQAFFDIGAALLHLDFEGAADAAKRGWNRMVADAKAGTAAIEGIVSESSKRIASLLDDTVTAKKGGGATAAGGTERFSPKPKGGGADIVAQWRQELEEIKLQQGLFSEWSMAQEASFWAGKLALVQKGSKEYAAAYKMFYTAVKAVAQEQVALTVEDFKLQIEAAKNNEGEQKRIADELLAYLASIYGANSRQYKAAVAERIKIDQQWAAQHAQVAKIAAQEVIDASKFELEQARAGLQQGVALFQISKQQQLAAEREYTAQLYEIDRAALEQQLLDQNLTIVQREEIHAKLLGLERTYQAELTKIDNAAELDRQQYALQVRQALESTMVDTLDKLITNTKNWKQTFLDAANSIVASLNKIASQAIIQQFFGAGTAGGDMLNKIAGIFGGGAGNTAQVTATTANTTAVTALTAAIESQLAAGGMGGAGSIFSSLLGGATDVVGMSDPMGFLAMAGIPFYASGSPYIPRDMLAVVHKGERVVPAVDNRTGAYKAGPVVVNNHFHVDGTVDGRTQAQIAAESARSVNRVVSRI